MLDSIWRHTNQNLIAHRRALAELVASEPRELTRDELTRVLPPRGPAGSKQNRWRGLVFRRLNARGFTFDGRRFS